MSDWGTALIAACAAVAGGAVTGWYGRSAGVRQAEAARHAGDRQADALLDTVRLTLREESAARTHGVRRQTYVRFLDAAESVVLAERTGQGSGDDRAAFQRAQAEVSLEGPGEVAKAARDLADLLRRHARPDEVERAKELFVSAARAALRE